MSKDDFNDVMLNVTVMVTMIKHKDARPVVSYLVPDRLESY